MPAIAGMIDRTGRSLRARPAPTKKITTKNTKNAASCASWLKLNERPRGKRKTQRGIMSKQKLELTWIGKDKQPVLEPRILIEDPEKSYGDKSAENMLIFGDNLLALKALEQDFAGKVKCVFIDPPYNTGSAFTHYDDGLEHSIWLSMMRERMQIIRRLMSNDGSIWITIDDNENHYFKVMMDELFGRQNFITTIIWQKIFTVKNSARHFSDMHDYIVVYAKDASIWQRKLLPRSAKLDNTYTNPDVTIQLKKNIIFKKKFLTRFFVDFSKFG